MMKRILVVGGDRRQSLLAGLLRDLGAVDTLAVPDRPDTAAPGMYDLLILPTPTLDAHGYIRAAAPLAPATLLPYCGASTRVFGGALNGGAGLPAPLGAACDLLADPTVKALNGRLTAEAFFALPRAGKGLTGSRCLVLGWGCIGRPLSLLLRSFGASVTVAARRQTVRAEAEGLGLRALPFSDVHGAWDFVCSTVPACTLTDAQLAEMGPDCLWFELASAPGGLPARVPDGLTLVPAGGLPGKYLPRAAAEVLRGGIARALEGAL